MSTPKVSCKLYSGIFYHSPHFQVISLSFSGCGFLGMYHVGVLCRIRELMAEGKIHVAHASGASAGALAATALILNLSDDLLKEKFRSVITS